jgi:hypothetical protein
LPSAPEPQRKKEEKKRKKLFFFFFFFLATHDVDADATEAGGDGCGSLCPAVANFTNMMTMTQNA